MGVTGGLRRHCGEGVANADGRRGGGRSAYPVAVSIFLLSPARCDGRRAQLLLNPAATFPIAEQLRQPGGAPIGDVFAFLSGLYFRGKLTYARMFGPDTTHVITTDRGIVPPGTRVTVEDVERFATVDLSKGGESFLVP